MPERNSKIKVFVVDDSAVSCGFLMCLLESDPDIQVIGSAHSGREAIVALGSANPDVVTMDIHMPGMDGFEATREIMETRPLPIVIVSGSYEPSDVVKTFRAMEAGAVAAIEKPPGSSTGGHSDAVSRLIDTVKAMSEVRVVRRWNRQRMENRANALAVRPGSQEIRMVVIGASTGGPPVLRTLLAALPKPVPVPVLIVQHMSAGFIHGLIDWLSVVAGMPVRLAQHGEIAQPGVAYLAPDAYQMGVDAEGRISCTLDSPEHCVRPSVSYLFRSAARGLGAQAVGVLLTGMGRDGAEELKLMREYGAVTIAQDVESSIVHGMPGEAIRIGAATHVCNPERIAEMLASLVMAGRCPPAGT